MRIIVVKRGSDFHVSVVEDPNIWASGKTESEAMGNLLQKHGNFFGVVIEFSNDQLTRVYKEGFEVKA